MGGLESYPSYHRARGEVTQSVPPSQQLRWIDFFKLIYLLLWLCVHYLSGFTFTNCSHLTGSLSTHKNLCYIASVYVYEYSKMNKLATESFSSPKLATSGQKSPKRIRNIRVATFIFYTVCSSTHKWSMYDIFYKMIFKAYWLIKTLMTTSPTLSVY